jgi:NAD(P)-dependent dehydrogenase (short-subunit alcohol dehydrogenase family)
VKLAGKQAIVTGAGSGIGAALCRALSAAGADVVCTDVDAAAAWLFARLAPGLIQRMSIRFIARRRETQSRSSVDLS